MTIDMAQFHQAFYDDSFEGLDTMEAGLLNMAPGSPCVEEINAVFRAAHSIKGGSGTFGLMHISDFTHAVETLLGAMRDGRRRVTVDAVSTLLQSTDVLRDMLTAARDGGSLDGARIESQYAALDRALDDEGRDVGVRDGEGDGVPSAGVAAMSAWEIRFRPSRASGRDGHDVVRTVRRLAALGDLTTACDLTGLPPIEDLDPSDGYLGWTLRLVGSVDESQIGAVFSPVQDEWCVSLAPITVDLLRAPDTGVAGPAHAVPRPAAVATTPAVRLVDPAVDRRTRPDRRQGGDRRTAAVAPGAASSTIRVDVDKIDALIAMAGEVAAAQARLDALSARPEAGSADPWGEPLAALGSRARDLQRLAMQIRMVPVESVFSRFPRLVRDLCDRLDKQAKLVIGGGDTEVDRAVAELIVDPLVHLVRNSIDHGLETTVERRAAGKPVVGKIRLQAARRGAEVVIEVSDDGRGLLRDRILDRARERGLVIADERLDEQAVFALIFRPGFSTAPRVTDISGRGVGMDVVLRSVERLGGVIEIDSTPGQGCTFTLRLPQHPGLGGPPVRSIGGTVQAAAPGPVVRGDVVSLPASLTGSGVAALRVALCEQLQGATALTIDASGVEAVDGAGLQLLAALFKSANQACVEVRWREPSGALVETARLLGMAPLLGLGSASLDPTPADGT